MNSEATHSLDLGRLFRPRSIAIVGASDSQLRSRNAASAIRESGIKLYLINPNRPEVHGAPAFPSLEAIDEPVDAVLSLVGAESTVALVEQCGELGVGGVVAIAAGFGEGGASGEALAHRLAAAGARTPVIGPNCNGFINVWSGARLSGAPRLPLARGRIAFITQSGGFMGAAGIAGEERGIGFSYLFSTGNEIVVDAADCIDYLVDDENTAAIGLVIETVRRPQAFFRAVARAHEAGKPIVAVKLGRSSRAKEMATSHTGAIAGEFWVYESAFRQHGIALAHDFVDLIDRLALFEHLDPKRWRVVNGLAIASLSGGWAAMTSDICAEERIELPRLSGLKKIVGELIPNTEIINPLDLTGVTMSRPDLAEKAFRLLLDSPEVDALIVQWFLEDGAAEQGEALIGPVKALASASDKPIILGSIEDGRLGAWARDLPRAGVVPGRGPRATLRALKTMSDFVRYRSIDRAQRASCAINLDFPDLRVVESEAGPILDFASAMRLLDAAGIPRAPSVVLGPADHPGDAGTQHDGPFVVKLGDVAHRSDIGAVRLGIHRREIGVAVDELRRLAARLQLPATVVVQPQLQFESEAFVGIKSDTGLGPMIVAGVGGIFVELLKRVSGRLAPLGDSDVDAVLADLDETGFVSGFRGSRPWDRKQFGEILLRASDLATSSSAWLSSLDINPLGFGPAGFVAVDALCTVRPDAAGNKHALEQLKI